MSTVYASTTANPRELHLVDIENLLGEPHFRSPLVAMMRTSYVRVADASPDAQYVVATSAGPSLIEAGLGWGNCRRVFRRGTDGADIALLDAVEDDLPRRFDRVVIGSGDHCFSFLAARLQEAGVSVTVVARPGSLSRRLALSVRDVRYVPPLSMRPGAPLGGGWAA